MALLTITAPGTDRKTVCAVPECSDGFAVVCALVPGAGAGVGANGRVPHLVYTPTAKFAETVSLALYQGTAAPSQDAIELLFDCGAHVLPWPGTLALTGGTGTWTIDIRMPNRAPSQLGPRKHWLATWVNGSSGGPANFAMPSFHSYIRASEDVLLTDALSHSVLVDHREIPAMGGTYTVRDPVYLYTAVEF